MNRVWLSDYTYQALFLSKNVMHIEYTLLVQLCCKLWNVLHLAEYLQRFLFSCIFSLNPLINLLLLCFLGIRKARCLQTTLWRFYHIFDLVNIKSLTPCVIFSKFPYPNPNTSTKARYYEVAWCTPGGRSTESPPSPGFLTNISSSLRGSDSKVMPHSLFQSLR